MPRIESFIRDGRVKLASTALAATLAVGACSADLQSPKPTQIPSEAIPTAEPTQRVIETQKPTEAPLSMEQQASNAGFDYWFSFLNANQKQNYPAIFYYLNTSIQNPDAWKHNVETIKKGETQDSPLVINWIGGSVYYANSYTTTEAQGIKSQGTLTIENIKLTSVRKELTTTDQQQGITDSFTTTLSFDYASQENEFWPIPGSTYPSPKVVEKWLLTPDATPYLPAQQFSDEDPMNMVLKNGRWEQAMPDYFTRRDSYNEDPLKLVALPVSNMASGLSCQQPPIGPTSCQVIRTVINY